jgi:uncharacterized protein YbjT (DUF2867 family)
LSIKREEIMKSVLVTGATSLLGKSLVSLLVTEGYEVRMMSRQEQPNSQESHTDWVQADLETKSGLQAALDGVNIIVHAATNPVSSVQTDVCGTKNLLEYGRLAKVEHFVYPSIVGIDSNPFRYYQSKLAAEKLVQESGLPWTILRATQFHSFVDRVLSSLSRLPWLFVPSGFRFQSVAVNEVAMQIRRCIQTGPGGRQPDFGGPEIHTIVGMAEQWLSVQKLPKSVAQLPLWGKTAQAFRRGDNLLKQGVTGQIGWEGWLHDTYSKMP